ncbi:MAG TPA: hypothetical protein ENF42_02235 [Candidatus Bathyarchaeota archaeon]|nr:hypothetical protein [Candidatus Bathyarchaeota archaeon]
MPPWPHEEKYLFFEVRIDRYGVLVNGSSSKIMIDFPMYVVEDSTLRVMGSLELNSSVILLLGGLHSISGDMGGGVSSNVYPVLSLPYIFEDVEILSVGDGGRVEVAYNGTFLTLKPGESWNYSYSVVEEFMDGFFNITVTIAVENYGYLSVIGGDSLVHCRCCEIWERP